jgi:hypothetical protein
MFKTSNFEQIKLVWVDSKPPIDIEQIELEVRNDIERSLKGLKKPSDLKFHTVFLGETIDDQNISVWGVPNDDETFYCTWYETAEWGSLDESGLEKVNDE